MKFNNIEFGAIRNVRASSDEEGVYFVDIEIIVAEGFPPATHLFCAKADDYAVTGKWVYQQILDGNFEGEITQLVPNADPSTGLPYAQPENVVQPTSQGAQSL